MVHLEIMITLSLVVVVLEQLLILSLLLKTFQLI